MLPEREPARTMGSRAEPEAEFESGKLSPSPAESQASGPNPKRSEVFQRLGCDWLECSLWRRIILDDRLTSEEFRLWHYFRDQLDADGYVRPYFAEGRTVAAALGWRYSSLSKRCARLVECGYLFLETRGREHRHLYRVLDGLGQPVKEHRKRQMELPMPHLAGGPLRVCPSAHAKEPMGNVRVCPSAHAKEPLYIQGNVSNEWEGKAAPGDKAWSIRKILEAAERIKAEIKRSPPSADRAERLRKANITIRTLQDQLIGFDPADIPAQSHSAVSSSPVNPKAKYAPAPDEQGPAYGTPAYEQWYETQWGPR